MKHTIASALLLLSIGMVRAQNTVTDQLVESVSENSLKTNLNIIAGSRFEGRMAATTGDSLAIDYISNWFGTHHLSNPFQAATPYLQNVGLIHPDYSKSTLSINGKAFELDKQWTYFNGAHNFSPQSTELVFVGYGISTAGFDEFKGVDIEGELIVLMPEFPNLSKGKQIIDEKNLPSEEQHVMNIVNKKPLGILVYLPDFKDFLKENEYRRSFARYHVYLPRETPTFSGCLFSTEVGNYLVGGNIDSLYQLILDKAQPHSFSIHKPIALSIIKDEEHFNTNNVVGIIKGTNESLSCVVFTAHHDHEGKVGNATYFGADDNGSGTVALLEISKILGDASARGIRPKRTIVFVSTAAEEQGLIGSYAYVQHPVIPLTKTYCNINVDMLGRVDSFYSGKRPDSNYVYCMYKDSTSLVFNQTKLEEISQEYGHVKLDPLYDIKGKKISMYSLVARSDNFPFMKEGIPAIWFFSGFHHDYHEPTDTQEKINYPLLKKRTQLVLATLWRVANE
jgi:Peptidase family M28